MHKVKDKMTRELTKEVKDMDRENNEVSELVAVLALVQLEPRLSGRRWTLSGG